MGKNNGQKIVVSSPVMQMKITLLNDGRLAVNGFPANYDTAMGILAAATKAVAERFIAKAKEGKLDDQNNIIESKIIQPKVLI